MKILFITPWYPHKANPNSGIFIRDQAELASKNHEVAVVFSTVDYERFAWSSAELNTSSYKKITEYRLIVKRSFFLFNQLNYLVRASWQIWKVARQFKPDLVQANVSYPSAFFARIIRLAWRCPYVVVEHTKITNHFRSAYHRMATIHSLKYATGLFAVSRNLAKEMGEVIGKEVNVLPNVIDTDRFSVTPFSNGIPQIGFLGALHTQVKGLDILLQALSGMHRDYVLHVGGWGALLEEYKSMAEDFGIKTKCKFYGFVSHADVPAFMQKLSFFVSASRYETFGIVIIEAMASGRPVVVTRSGGPEDFVDPENGILVPSQDPTRLREGIEYMIDHYAGYDQKKIAARVKERFSTKAMSEKLESIYSAMARRTE